MARTRKQKQDVATAARKWSRTELRRLLDAWRCVLRHPQARNESAHELEYRLFTQFCIASNARVLSTSSHAMAPAAKTRTAADVARTAKMLKRSFRFVAEYNQTNSCDSSSDNDASGAWFKLSAAKRRQVLQSAQRGRRSVALIDLDAVLFRDLKYVIAHSMTRCSQWRNSTDTDVMTTAPWSADELRQLLRAWRETIVDANVPRVHSEAYAAALYERFLVCSNGAVQRCEASVRHAKAALTALAALMRDVDTWCAAPDAGWLVLPPAQRAHICAALEPSRETFAALDAEMFTSLGHTLALEDMCTSVPASHSMHSGCSTPKPRVTVSPDRSIVNIVNVVSWDADSVDNGAPNQKSPSTGTGTAGLASSREATKCTDIVCSSYPCASHSAVSAVATQGVDDKRLRVDPELLTVVGILEREAQRLRAMLCEAEADRAERRVQQAQMQCERVAWQLERSALLQELAWLRHKRRKRL